MARLDASLIQGLMNPTYAGALRDVGKTAGMLGGQMRQERIAKEHSQKMAGMSPVEQIQYAQQNVARTPQEQMDLSTKLATAKQQQTKAANAAADRDREARERAAKVNLSAKGKRYDALMRAGKTESAEKVFEEMTAIAKDAEVEVGQFVTELPEKALRGKDIYIELKDGTLYNTVTKQHIPNPTQAQKDAASSTRDISQDARSKLETIAFIKEKAAQYSEGDEGGNIIKGVKQSLMSMLSGSEAKAVYKGVDELKAKLSFDELTRMREASKTGGALGSITERELEQLGKTVKDLSPESPLFLKNLDYVESYYEQILDEAEGPEGGSSNFQAGTPVYQSPVDGLVYDFDGSISGKKGARLSDAEVFAYFDAMGIE